MTENRQWQPAVGEAPQTVPADSALLTAPRKRTLPKPAHRNPKSPLRRKVHGRAVVADVPTHDRSEPLALFGDGIMHAPLKLAFHLVQLRLQSFTDRLPQHGEHSVAPLFRTNVCEAEEVECLRLPFSTPLPIFDRKGTELQKPRLLGMQLQVELTASASQRVLLPRLNTRPARSPVNASAPLLRATLHDSGPMWVASSQPYDFSIHYTSPV